MLTSNVEVTKILILRLNKPTCGAEGDSVSVGQWGDVQCMDKSIEPHLLMFEVRFTVLLCPEKPNAPQHTRKQKNASKGHKRQQKWNKAFDLSRSHNHSHRWIKYSKHLLKNMSCSKELAELSWQWFLVTLYHCCNSQILDIPWSTLSCIVAKWKDLGTTATQSKSAAVKLEWGCWLVRHIVHKRC